MWVALAITAASGLGCNDQSSLAPTRPTLVPRRDGLPGATTLTGAFGVQATNDVNEGAFGPISLGVNIPARSRYVVHITGQITVSPNPSATCSPSFPAVGTVGPRGYDQELGIEVLRTAGGYINLHYPAGSTDVLESDTVWTGSAIDLLLSRSGIIGSVNCPDGTHGLYALSGQQTITVNVIEVVPRNTAVLTPDTALKMKSGDTLTLSVYPKYPDTGEHMFVQSPNGPGWVFLPDSSASNPTPTPERIGLCYNDWSCNFTATRSGTIKVYYAFDPPFSFSPVDSAMVHVDVITCPWDDPVIDDPMVRLELKDWLHTSDSLNVERGGVILQDTLTKEYDVQYSLAAGTTPTQCRFAIAVVSQVGFKLVGLWHTHPINGGKRFSNCPTAPSGSIAAWGPSNDDFGAQADAPGNLPMYIIDHNDVHRIKNASRSNKAAWNTPATTVKKNWSSCPGWAP